MTGWRSSRTRISRAELRWRDNFIAVKGSGLRLVGGHPAYVQFTARNEVFPEMEFAEILSQRPAHVRYAGALAAMDAWLRTAGSQSPRGRSSLLGALGNACKAWTLPGSGLAPFRVIPADDPVCTVISRRASVVPPPR